MSLIHIALRVESQKNLNSMSCIFIELKILIETMIFPFTEKGAIDGKVKIGDLALF